MDNEYQSILKALESDRCRSATELKAIEQEKLMMQEAKEAKFKQIEQMLIQQSLMQQKQKSSFMQNFSPREEAESAMQELAQALDEMYEWGLNAKDPLGNFLPDAIAVNVRDKFQRLRWLLSGLFSDGGPWSGSMDPKMKW